MRRVPAHRLLTALFLAFTMIATAFPASAGGYHHRGKFYGGYHHGYKSHGYRNHHYKHFKRHHGHRHHGHYRHRHHHKRYGNDDFLLGAGILGGAIIVGSVLSQPRRPSPPVYYAPPPAPTCVQGLPLSARRPHPVGHPHTLLLRSDR